MASGKLGTTDLSAAVEATLYTVPAGKVATVNVNLCNRNPTPAKIRLAMGTGANAANADYVEYDTVLPANGVLERMGFVLSASEKVFVYSDIANVSVRAHGFEE